jgi:hypothetical protein
MAASFPTSTKSFSTKTDGPSQVISASHINDLQDEVVAVENELGRVFAAISVDATNFVDSSTQPRCSAYNTTTQSLSDNTLTALALNAEDFDVGTMHDTVTANTRMTIPTGGDGLYLITGQATFATNATGVRDAYVKKNGTTYLSFARGNGNASGLAVVTVSVIAVLAAADYVELWGRQNSGGALNSGDATRETSNILQIVKLW